MEWWNTTNPSFKLFVGIATINVLVFIGWKVPRFQPFMAKHFMTNTTISKFCISFSLLIFVYFRAIEVLANAFVDFQSLFGHSFDLQFNCFALILSNRWTTFRLGPTLGFLSDFWYFNSIDYTFDINITSNRLQASSLLLVVI